MSVFSKGVGILSIILDCRSMSKVVIFDAINSSPYKPLHMKVAVAG